MRSSGKVGTHVALLRRLQAVALLPDVPPAELDAAMAAPGGWQDGPASSQDESEAGAPGSEGGMPYPMVDLFGRVHGALLLRGPQRAADSFAALKRVPNPPLAFQGKKPRIVLRDVPDRPRDAPWARLTVDGVDTDYAWSSRVELVGVVNEALARAGDPRRYATLRLDDPDFFMLLTREQEALLGELGWIDAGFLAPTLPRVAVDQALIAGRTLLGAEQRLEELAALFRVGDPEPTIAGSLEDGEVLYTTQSTRPGIVLLVVEGIAGQASGGIACELALEGLGRAFAAAPPADSEGRRRWLRDAFATASAHLRDAAAAPTLASRPHAAPARGRRIDDGDLRWGGGGASIAIAALFGRSMYVAHAGNARVLLRRAPRWKHASEALTVDDSLEAAGAPQPGHEEVVTRALGFVDEPSALAERELAAGDAVLLATRGLFRTLDAPAIDAVLVREEPLRWSLQLLTAARERGSRSATALVAVLQ